MYGNIWKQTAETLRARLLARKNMSIFLRYLKSTWIRKPASQKSGFWNASNPEVYPLLPFFHRYLDGLTRVDGVDYHISDKELIRLLDGLTEIFNAIELA